MAANITQKLSYLWRLWVEPIFPILQTGQALRQYGRYFRDWRQYRRLAGSEPLHLISGYPRLMDATQSTPFDAHYFYQGVWATERIARLDAKCHVDIGSEVRFVGLLTTHKPTIFLDYRPLKAKLPDLNCLAGDILRLPIKTASVQSLSCMHVVEHIGLGRYGDPLNPLGTQQACAELARILAPGGNLFFSTPIGKNMTRFNAHRIHRPSQILSFFSALELVEFSVVDDQNRLKTQVELDRYENAHYSCGLFWFRQSPPKSL